MNKTVVSQTFQCSVQGGKYELRNFRFSECSEPSRISRSLWISKEFRIPAIRTFPPWLDLILIQDDRIIDLTIYAMIM